MINLFLLGSKLFKPYNCVKAMSSINKSTYLSQKNAINLDQDLFNECGFSVDQLMELAGLSVASVIKKAFDSNELKNQNILLICGPGNNGGDGLVAARHLKLFGFQPEIYYPKQGKNELFSRLVKQCKTYGINFLSKLDNINYHIIVDALFGFSFKPPLRSEFIILLEIINQAQKNGSKLVSVDIPSGWNVETGPIIDRSNDTPYLSPDCLISLSYPKMCANHFKGDQHWLGGRFLPDYICKKYNLPIIQYPSIDQCLKL